MGLWAWLMGDYDTRSEVVPEQPPPIETLIPKRSEQPVSEGSILRTINVYRAVQLLTMAAGQLSIDVWRGPDQIERPSLVKRPDIKQRDLASFVKRSVASLALTGNAYWLVSRNARNEASNLEVLNPHECTPQTDGTLAWAGRNRDLQPHEFQHLGLLWVPGTLEALGPIQAARMELTGALKTTKYGTEVFHTSGDTPSGILKTDQPLSPSQAKEYKTQWQSRDAHEVAVLGQGLDYAPIMLSPRDAQFIESRQFDTTSIARLFGIPASLFMAQVEGSSLTYTNMAQADMSFARWTLMAYLSEIEQAITAVLPSTQVAKFNLDALIRPDTKSRYEAHQLGIAAGWLKPSEVRAIEGLPPIPGIDDQPATQPSTGDTDGA